MEHNRNKRFHILGIAPYEGLHHLMETLVEKREDIDLDVITADLDSGVEALNSSSTTHYDVIISRGATAKLIRNHTATPVVEIPLSIYDVLRAIKLTEHSSGQIAIVGFSEVTSIAHQLCEMLAYNIDIYTVTAKEDIPKILAPLKERNINFILCDASTEPIAKKNNLTPILITSGIESVQNAFQIATHICYGFAKLQNENMLLLETLKVQSSSNFIFDSKQNLYLANSNFKNEGAYIEQYLSELIPTINDSTFDKSFHFIHQILYSISLRIVSTDQERYYIFSVSSNPVPQSGSKYGIHYSDEIEMRNYYFQSFYSLTIGINTNEQIHSISQNFQPVMILGEKGTGKDHVAAKIYLESSLSTKPYVSINCDLINQKHWNYLVNSYNSPLCDNDNTIFISNIQALSLLQRKQLLSLILDTYLCKRNHLIFSCSTTPTNSNEDPARDFIDYLPCVTLNLPPLRELTGNLPSSSSLYLNRLNAEHSKEIVGFTPAAMNILKSYSWPQNYMQLKRVLSEMVMLTDSSFIKEDLVEQLIEKEKLQFPESNVTVTSSFNYDRTLDEMNREIIKHTLKQCNGNQSKAAKQLGISRTTIWRYLN